MEEEQEDPQRSGGRLTSVEVDLVVARSTHSALLSSSLALLAQGVVKYCLFLPFPVAKLQAFLFLPSKGKPSLLAVRSERAMAHNISRHCSFKLMATN